MHSERLNEKRKGLNVRPPRVMLTLDRAECQVAEVAEKILAANRWTSKCAGYDTVAEQIGAAK